jgi:hypothetical protein
MLSGSLDLETNFSKAQHFRSRGQFKDAWRYLEKASSQSTDSFDSLVKKCHLLTVQGYHNRVVEILDPVVGGECLDLNEDRLCVLRLQLAAAKVETEGKLEDANKLVAFIWNEISDGNELDGNISGVRCWTLLYLAYTTFLLQKYAQYTYDMEDRVKIGLNERMNSGQLRLSEMGDHSTAWDMLQCDGWV